jgi:thioredoxin 1
MLEVSHDTFAQEVLQSERPVLVDFWGPRCGPCLALIPQVENLERIYGEKVKVVKIDATKNRRLCLELRVLGLPTYLLYKNGENIGRLTGGELKIQDIEDLLKKAL